MTIYCPSCRDTGMKYEGNGHRMSGYPYAEKYVSVACGCGPTRVGYEGALLPPMPPAREVTDAEKRRVAAHKAAFNIRADAYAAKVKAEMDELRAKPGYREPLWFTEQKRQQGERK